MLIRVITCVQAYLIMSFGATENELQAVFIKMLDWQRLTLARRQIAHMELLGKKGTLEFCSYCFR